MKGWGLKSVLITGGEPFIRTGIMDFLSEAQSIGLETSVLSNGLKVSEFARTHRGVMEHLKVAQISLDAMTPWLHDARRGVSGAWEQATDAIKVLNHLGVPIEISCTVSEDNVKELPAINDYCQSIGANLLIRSIRPIGRASITKVPPGYLRRLTDIIGLHNIDYTCDQFLYVPVSNQFDSKALKKHIITIEANGRLRCGSISICGISEVKNVYKLLEVA